MSHIVLAEQQVLGARNPKSEILNPKQIRMTEQRKSKTRSRRRRAGILVWFISVLNLLIVSDFELRVSGFRLCQRQRCASGGGRKGVALLKWAALKADVRQRYET